MSYPLVSIIIASLNSEATLERVLKAIKSQDYPKHKIETLYIDGGSKDRSISIAKKFKCKIIDNPKVDFLYGKFIGYKKARGRFVLLLDSDEEMKNKKSIRQKVEVFLENKNVGAVISSGYETPLNYPSINDYINGFGDPFTFYMYRISKNHGLFLKQLKSRYALITQDSKKAIFDFSKSKNLPFIEFISMGVMLDLKYIRKNFPKVFKSVPEHTHLFYLLSSKKVLFAVMKNDPIVHYSVANFIKYLRKIRSRITSNIFRTNMGIAGFSGREEYYSRWFSTKKYLFFLYTFSLMLPVIDSIYLLIERKRSIYLIHVLLCFYTATMIIYYTLKKILGLNVKNYLYGGK